MPSLRASLCRLLGSSSSRRAAWAQLPSAVSRAWRIAWRWQASTLTRNGCGADTGKATPLPCGTLTAGGSAALSRSSSSDSRVRIAPRSPPRLSRRSAARLITCSSSRTLPGQA